MFAAWAWPWLDPSNSARNFCSLSSNAGNDMITGSEKNRHEDSKDLPQWADCDFFGIHDYAGAGASPCGWRGRLQDTRHDENGEKLLCPRCRCATLLRIPPERADQSGAQNV